MLLLGKGLPRSTPSLPFDYYCNSEGATDDSHSETISGGQALRQRMQQKAHRIIWDSYHVFKEKTRAGIVDIPKSNFKKQILENVLFKKTGEEEQARKKKTMRRAG